MDLDRIGAANEVLLWMSNQASNLAEERQEALAMSLSLQIASLYLSEYQMHVLKGMEPYDALLATAKGELELSQRQKDLWRSMVPPGGFTGKETDAGR